MKSKKTKMENNDLFRYETNKEKRRRTHLSWTIVLPLLATTSGAIDHAWDMEEWETTGECLTCVIISVHQTQKYDSIKWNPRKRKWKTMIHSVMRLKKKRKSTHLHRLFCHCLQLLQEPLTMSERGKNKKLPVSANIINSQQSKDNGWFALSFHQN